MGSPSIIPPGPEECKAISKNDRAGARRSLKLARELAESDRQNHTAPHEHAENNFPGGLV
jgi:hypothetical protein